MVTWYSNIVHLICKGGPKIVDDSPAKSGQAFIPSMLFPGLVWWRVVDPWPGQMRADKVDTVTIPACYKY